MSNGMILRGEVYWVSVDDSTGGEIQTGRPAVIISGDRANETSTTVIVAFITTQGNPHPHNVSIRMNGGPRRVKCDQIRTVAKERLTRYVCTLTKPEMVRVTGALATAQCIPIRPPESTPQEQENKELIALKAECEMWKRCYDVVMTQLVDLKVSSDLALRMARMEEPEYEYEEEIEDEESPVVEAPVVEETVEEPPKEPEQPEETERVEINTCSAEDLKRCGCNPEMIENIIKNRPYMSVEDLRVVHSITSVAYGILKHSLCCVPVKVEEPEQKIEESKPVVEAEEPETTVVEPVVEEPVKAEEPAKVVMPKLDKVNINTATIREMAEHLGIGVFYPAKISAHRNKNGKFVALEELKMVEGLPKNFYDRYAHLCTIGEPEQPVEEQPVEKPERKHEPWGGAVNVNTATAQEIFERTGLNIYIARNIVAYRKKNGPFRDIASLMRVNHFGAGCLKAYGDMLTVGEPEEEQEPESDKVNINTASLRELMAVGFEKRAAALIVNERKKYGRFRSVDDLSAISEISGKILRKLRDKLEV